MCQSPGSKKFNRFGAPTLGQHNREILGEELGLSSDEIEDLTTKEIIGITPRGLSR
jgi:crotonobetainyl-CoA:carnitine CoA-transferase CaiB-like acyl-CoA transferase